jgi:hypothetical protein
MLTARRAENGTDSKWYATVIEPSGARRAGYCAKDCAGHSSSEEALAHYLQYQLDRETDLWLERQVPAECEMCGDPTRLRARLGKGTKLFVLCDSHQSTSSLQTLFRRRHAAAQPV